MGRWAQRRRGSSSVQGSSLNFIRAAHSADLSLGFIDLTYEADVDAGSFALTDFETQLGSLNPGALGNTASNVIQLDFGTDLTGETGIVYSGAVAGILTPQTKTLS